MPDRPRAEISHLTPGRLRLRIPERRRDDAFFARVRQHLSDRSGVVRVDVNPITASVLIQFNGAAEDFAARDDDLFELDDFPLEPSPLDAVRDEVVAADRTLRQLTGGADLRTLLFFALLAGGLYQLVRGNIAAPAVTLLWYACEALGLWGPPIVPATVPASDAAPT
jgi:hypothetical protein